MKRLLMFLKRKVRSISAFNSIRGKRKNRIVNKGWLYRSKIRFKGENNVVEINDNAKLIKCRIVINGSNNRIIIGADSYLQENGICMEFDNNRLEIGKRCIFSSRDHFSVCEGKNISFGNDCLISADLHCRTTDSHTIVNEEGKRINFAKDIHVGNHVWIGANVVLLKGATVANDSVVSYGSIVTKAFGETNCVIAGVPATIVKREINWDKKLYR